MPDTPVLRSAPTPRAYTWLIIVGCLALLLWLSSLAMALGLVVAPMRLTVTLLALIVAGTLSVVWTTMFTRVLIQQAIASDDRVVLAELAALRASIEGVAAVIAERGDAFAEGWQARERLDGVVPIQRRSPSHCDR